MLFHSNTIKIVIIHYILLCMII